MDIGRKQLARLRALQRVTRRKHGLPLAGQLLTEIQALSARSHPISITKDTKG